MRCPMVLISRIFGEVVYVQCTSKAGHPTDDLVSYHTWPVEDDGDGITEMEAQECLNFDGFVSPDDPKYAEALKLAQENEKAIKDKKED